MGDNPVIVACGPACAFCNNPVIVACGPACAFCNALIDGVMNAATPAEAEAAIHAVFDKADRASHARATYRRRRRMRRFDKGGTCR